MPSLTTPIIEHYTLPLVTGTRLDDAMADLAVLSEYATEEEIDEIADYVNVYLQDIKTKRLLKD